MNEKHEKQEHQAHHIIPESGQFANEESRIGEKPVLAQWSHLVGKLGSEVIKIIQEENPRLKVMEVPVGSMVTMDMRTDRVRVWVDENGIVTRAPRVG